MVNGYLRLEGITRLQRWFASIRLTKLKVQAGLGDGRQVFSKRMKRQVSEELLAASQFVINQHTRAAIRLGESLALFRSEDVIVLVIKHSSEW